PQCIAGEQPDEFRPLRFGRVQIEQRQGRLTGDGQAWLGDGLGLHGGGEVIAQPRETVVEVQLVQAFHGQPQGLAGGGIGCSVAAPAAPSTAVWPICASWPSRFLTNTSTCRKAISMPCSRNSC